MIFLMTNHLHIMNLKVDYPLPIFLLNLLDFLKNELFMLDSDFFTQKNKIGLRFIQNYLFGKDQQMQLTCDIMK